ncbi:MAG: hypothetical protein KBG47_00945 [Bacteroidia bacterium]|jgi:hypothetical protein|nr:hypothetical protein [Sphingobacteriaceae bacterium]MBK7311992.1 hypothetical protein [Sphingobacteriaceae bacterium]MBK7816680.1 hypothetical protein [Sphingobacteriaceae bacterium]MBP9068041.1 hypothetical protein [Bacteroidia bacterium]
MEKGVVLLMNSLKGIKYVGLVLIIFSCKKKPAPESEYLLERDNKTTKTATTLITPVITYQPTVADSITAIFVCQKGRYFSVNGGRYFMNSFYYYDAASTLSFDSLIKRVPTKMNPNVIQFVPGDSSDITISYPIGNIVIHSTRGFPNCKLGQFPQYCAVCFEPNNQVANYEITYGAGHKNTDKIYSQGNGYLGLDVGIVNLKPSYCSSGKRCYYSIYFENYSYFKVNGKWFVWINRIGDFCEAGH